MQPTPDEETAADRPADELDADVLGDRPVDAPVDDMAEQLTAADPTAEVDGGPDARSVANRGLEVGEWDAAEQTRTVSQEDDYRS
jgi:hypothetical protein